MDDNLLLGVSSIVAAILGATASRTYEEFIARPRLTATVQNVKRVRKAITLPDLVYADAYPMGSFHLMADRIVKWDVNDAFEKNSFTEAELKDLFHLLPQFMERLEANHQRASRRLTVVKQLGGTLSEEARSQLSALRGHWSKMNDEDVFVAYDKDPDRVKEQLVSETKGDLHQIESLKDKSNLFLDYLDIGFSSSAPESVRIRAMPEDPETPRKPFVLVDILVQNVGRTDTLIGHTAELLVAGEGFPLRALKADQGFDVYSGSYRTIKGHSTELVTYSQDPDRTNQEQLINLKEFMAVSKKDASIVLHDFKGKTVESSQFDFSEF